jgi:hypothetical protein
MAELSQMSANDSNMVHGFSSRFAFYSYIPSRVRLCTKQPLVAPIDVVAAILLVLCCYDDATINCNCEQQRKWLFEIRFLATAGYNLLFKDFIFISHALQFTGKF